VVIIVEEKLLSGMRRKGTEVVGGRIEERVI
jgi:hypothetical protein